MADACEGRAGADYNELLDTLAEVCARDNSSAVADPCTHPGLQVPPALIA
jgi:hypothetical protein